MHRGNRWVGAIVLLALFAGCAGLPWPDEPGVAVALSRATNLQAADAFVAKLTTERRAANLPPPMLTPRYQDGIRAVAEDLQAGKLTAGEAQRAIDRWGQAAYHQPISTWMLDCAAGETMKVPRALVDRPSAVLSCAAAHFRPRSLANEQCAVLVVAIEGAAPVVPQ